LTRALLLGLAALALTAGGFFLGRRLSPPAPSPPVSASPAARATPARGGSLPAPLPGPPAAVASGAPLSDAPLARGVQRGEAAGVSTPKAARRAPRAAPPAAAPSLAPAGPEPPQRLEPPRPPGRRAFVAGLTQIGSTRGSGATLKGFDPTAVALKRAPESDGAIEFEVVPTQVQPGEPYVVKVYLRNRGEKAIRLKSLNVASEMNGRSSRTPLSPRSKAVEPSLVGLLAELPGVWKDDVESWSIEVEVLTGAGDTYSSRVTWK
jgi:hypothetical protein